jgi:hypothetical protein
MATVDVEDALQDERGSMGRTLGHIDRAEAMAVETLRELDAQRQRLEDVERKQDQMQTDVRIAAKLMGYLEYYVPPLSWFGWSDGSKKSTDAQPPGDRADHHRSSDTSSPRPGSPLPSDWVAVPPCSSSGSTVQVPDTSLPPRDRESYDQTGELLNGLRRLGQHGRAIGAELDDQNSLLERITEKNDRLTDNVKDHNRRIKGMLK